MASEITFFGDNLDNKHLEVIGLRIDPAHREGEADLWSRRWFDYRHMHPVAATYLYAHHYVEQTRRFYEQCIDIGTAQDARAFTPDDIFQSRDMTSMWLARRSADALGVPYPFALQFAQDRFFSRAQRQFPRPNQLYGEEFELDLQQSWKDRLDRQLTHAKLPHFQAAAWKGLPDQEEHLDFLVAQVKARPAPRYRLIGRLIASGVISSAQAHMNFTEDEARSADQYARDYL